MSVRAKYALGVALLAVAGVVWAINLPPVLRMWREESPAKPKPETSTKVVTYAPIGGSPIRQIDAGSLRGTIVTPHLDCAITGGKNVLWCATFQVAWNELCDLLGGPIQCRGAQEMAEGLNRRAVTRVDLDEASCVAMAGYPTGGPDDILDRIAAAMKGKFGEAVKPQLLPKRRSVGHDDWVAYACLFKELPFEWAFERMKDWGLTFGGHGVESFGIHQLRSREENEVKAAGQVLLYDYKSTEDFIIELKTQSNSDRLILAKIQPAATLSETIHAVEERLSASTPRGIVEMSDLFIPVLDFDVVRRYPELSDLGTAIQQIRFKLDETGAVLKSEAVLVKATADRLFFDKPFLVMIQRTDAQFPYFALWVANAELLVPFHQEEQRHRGPSSFSPFASPFQAGSPCADPFCAVASYPRRHRLI